MAAGSGGSGAVAAGSASGAVAPDSGVGAVAPGGGDEGAVLPAAARVASAINDPEGLFWDVHYMARKLAMEGSGHGNQNLRWVAGENQKLGVLGHVGWWGEEWEEEWGEGWGEEWGGGSEQPESQTLAL